MKIFKEIGFVWDCFQVYKEIKEYIDDQHVDEKIKDAVATAKLAIDKFAALFPDVQFLKDKYFKIFGKKGK